jgi:hypothetical protein
MLNKISSITAATVVAMSFIVAGEAQAATLTNGFTFSVASGSNTNIGNHFHSSTGGQFGNPAGKAEVGNFYSEEVRGLSEYNITGLGTATSAFVTFDVFNNAGLFYGANDFPFTGDIEVIAYQGNNLENISDYQALSIGTVGTFNTTNLGVEDTLSFDLTSIFNNALTNGSSSLGIRLQSVTNPQGGAWTFDNFRLTTDNQSTQDVPEPITGLVLAAGMGGAALRGAKSKKS